VIDTEFLTLQCGTSSILTCHVYHMPQIMQHYLHSFIMWWVGGILSCYHPPHLGCVGV